jgi:feruloyl esterase
VRGGDFAKDYEAKDPDIRPFLARGGKLILWHGGYDPGPSPLGTLRYYQEVQRVSGPAAAGGVRFFIVPGVYHCGGGPGPDHFDMLAAIDRWVSQGTPPRQVIATNAKSGLSRPLCPYPEAARYKGGDPMAAASFACASPSSRAEAPQRKDRAGG